MSDQPESGELVPAYRPEQPASLAGGPQFDPTHAAPAFWASWDTTELMGYALLSMVKNGEKRPLADHVNTVIDVQNVYIQTVKAVDEVSGEEYSYPWIVLCCEDGTLYSCGSVGVFSSVCDMLRFRPKTPWAPAMRVKIVRKALRNGRQTYSLLAVIDPPTKKGK